MIRDLNYIGSNLALPPISSYHLGPTPGSGFHDSRSDLQRALNVQASNDYCHTTNG